MDVIIKLHPEILQEYPILLNEEKQVSYQEPSKPIVDTQRLGKETLDMQKNTSKIDEVEQQMNTQMITQDLENGTLDNEEHKKKDSHKVEKGDDDYVM